MSKFNRSQKKRPFQPSVDSYFHHANEEINSLGVTPPHDPAIPRLPTAVQSSLLNVGMRVRKSIPEGYKICAKNLSGSATDTENHLGAVIEPWLPATPAASRPSELMPYCGILHVGGHENQPVMVEKDLVSLEFDPDDSDLIMSSQESATTTSVSIESTCSKKRPRDDLNDCSDLQPVASPLCPIGPTRLSNLNRIRHKLQPKSTTIRPQIFAADHQCERIIVDDFEDATFLRPKD